MDNAAENGHLNVVQYLVSIGEKCTTDSIDLAAYNGHLDIIKCIYAVSGRCRCTRNSMNWAYNNGHLDIIQFLEKKFLEEKETFGQFTWD
jgi:ankyrin repeat protein